MALLRIVLQLLMDLIALTAFVFRQRRATAAEILVLQRQITLYQERGIKPRRVDAVTRISLAVLSRFCNWRDALVVVRPETMLRVEIVLAAEVPSRPTADSTGDSGPDPPDGERESRMGRRTNCQ